MDSITSRSMQGDADFRKMRDLLAATVPITPVGFNWDVRRLDGKRFYDEDRAADRFFQRPVRLWEEADGLVGFILPEGSGDAHLQVHPDCRFLEDEMIAWAETSLAAPAEDGAHRQIDVYVNEYDVLRQRLLSARGFMKTNEWGMIRHMRLGRQPLAAPQMAEGYTLRTTCPDDPSASSGQAPSASSGQAPSASSGQAPSASPPLARDCAGQAPADCQRIADLLNAAFGRTFHNAQEYHNFAVQAPSFRQELDLVAEAPDGTFGAYVGIPYDAANRRGIFEPVCTHPAHRRLGLAQALMREGLLRLVALGAVDVTVDTGDMLAANRLYDSLGFTEAYRGFTWRKVF
jgi:ribosomal protein S18 acetylase RimI-like enzyme